MKVANDVREQNLRDAATLIDVIKNSPQADLARIWSDLTDAQVASEVDKLAHVVEWLNLS